MEFSIQILPPPTPFDGKKTFFFHNFFYVFIIFLPSNLARTLKKIFIFASFKMFRTKKLKSKYPSDSRDLCPDPPSNEKLKSSPFWMNQTILSIFVFFMKKTFFFSETSYGNWLDPPSMENSITFNVFFIETFPKTILFFGLILEPFEETEYVNG